jgi:hypothetical protein
LLFQTKLSQKHQSPPHIAESILKSQKLEIMQLIYLGPNIATESKSGELASVDAICIKMSNIQLN